MIKVENLSKSYIVYEKPTDRLKEVFSFFGNKQSTQKRFSALNDVSFEIQKGEILGIIGHNGAGKSTLLKIISNVTEPTSGTCQVDGVVNSILELGSTFNPELTGYENIDFYLQIKNIKDPEEKKKIVKEVVEFSELGDFLDQPVKTYSSGMFARLAFSTAINAKFDILIVDEVLSVGDIFFQTKCINKMKSLIDSDKIIVYVSHDMHSVKYFCDRVIYLDHGVVKENTTDVFDVVEKYEKRVESYEPTQQITGNASEYIKINSVKFLDTNGQEKNSFQWSESFSVKVNYDINIEIKDTFFGIGMRNGRNEYVSGLNTKLDKINLPHEIGNYDIELEYDGINLNSGVYELWAVFYNLEGTTVLSDHVIKNAFTVLPSKNLGEGVININHNWKI